MVRQIESDEPFPGMAQLDETPPLLNNARFPGGDRCILVIVDVKKCQWVGTTLVRNCRNVILPQLECSCLGVQIDFCKRFPNGNASISSNSTCQTSMRKFMQNKIRMQLALWRLKQGLLGSKACANLNK